MRGKTREMKRPQGFNIDPRKMFIELARREMSPMDVSNNTGLSYAAVYDILYHNGAAKCRTIGKIARCIGCDVTDILEDPPRKEGERK